MPYFLEAHRKANKELAALPKPVADGIRKALRLLAEDPTNPRLDLKRIQGHTRFPPTLRLRIGPYRVLLKIDHGRALVRVLRVGHRGTVYNGLEHLDKGLD